MPAGIRTSLSSELVLKDEVSGAFICPYVAQRPVVLEINLVDVMK